MSEKLHKFSLFASMNAETIDALTRGFPKKSFRKDELIIRQGQKGTEAFLLTEGKVGVHSESDEGTKTTVVIHNAPYLFGELELFQERPYLASISAMEPCSALIISRSNFLKLLHTNHQVSINLVQMLTKILYQTARDWRVRIFGRVEHLLANTLCSFAEMYGEEQRYGVLVRKEINKSEIAEILGVARKSVIRAFDQLQDEQLIQLEKKQLVIPDLAALRKKANSPFPLGERT